MRGYVCFWMKIDPPCLPYGSPPFGQFSQISGRIAKRRKIGNSHDSSLLESFFQIFKLAIHSI